VIIVHADCETDGDGCGEANSSKNGGGPKRSLPKWS